MLNDLAELLSQNLELLVPVHDYDSMTRYAVVGGLQVGRRYSYDFLVAFYKVPDLDTKCFSLFPFLVLQMGKERR